MTRDTDEGNAPTGGLYTYICAVRKHIFSLGEPLQQGNHLTKLLVGLAVRHPAYFVAVIFKYEKPTDCRTQFEGTRSSTNKKYVG
jgi:hypothetical protein